MLAVDSEEAPDCDSAAYVAGGEQRARLDTIFEISREDVNETLSAIGKSAIVAPEAEVHVVKVETASNLDNDEKSFSLNEEALACCLSGGASPFYEDPRISCSDKAAEAELAELRKSLV